MGLLDGAPQIAEPADVGDVEHDQDIRGLDLLRRPIGVISPVRHEKAEPLGDRRRVRDRRPMPACGEEVPQGDFASHTVAVGVDVRRQSDARTRPEHGRDRLRSGGAVGRNRNAV